MNIDLIIDAGPNEVMIALLQDKRLVELHREKSNNSWSVGDIHLGKVKRVVPGLNAAFVNVGYEKDAFLHYLDLGPQFASLTKFTKRTLARKQNTSHLDQFEMEKDIDKEGKVNQVISANQNILVQIAKEPISSKGPRLSSEITLAGRYLVLVPFSNKVSVSTKIKDDEERKRLKNIIESIRPKNFGVIIRTVAESKKLSELDQDLTTLMGKWDQCYKALKDSEPPKKVLGELDRTAALLRDLLNEKFNTIHVNDATLCDEIKTYVRKISPGSENIVKLYSGGTNIFDQFGIHKQIKAAFGKQVMLPSGGYLIIEHTEAMHVIDVNSGNRRSSDQEANALQVNLEAADEIARILRLRDMGGIVCVDFIDMGDRENQKKLFEHLRSIMKADRAKHNVLPPSKFGVVEITRQRVRPETAISTTEKCPCCLGSGEVEATILITDDIQNQLRYILEEKKASKITLSVHPFLHSHFTKGLFSIRFKWWMKYKKWIRIKGVTSHHMLEFHFTDQYGEEIVD
ncbi:MAG: Rne/Rng family ribonuclease [Flavobacteriales bacterium]|nr:Rne/Rng family ribonuclease [Flavobacteriales bacterium]